LEKDYHKNIRGIIKMLEGGSRQVMKDLEKQRDELSKKELFEEAAVVQKKINALSLITQPFHKPFEYDVNPNLRSDIRQQEMDALMNVLNSVGFALTKLERIECYDNSNMQGTNATSSMVVLTNGEIDKSQYRRFKVRRDWEKRILKKNSSPLRGEDLGEGEKPQSRQASHSPNTPFRKELPNDFAMMKEVLKRRFRHNEWAYPDLLIVDGGKGQVTSALKAFQELGIDIPLIGLAKREETIVVPIESIDSIKQDSAKTNGIRTLHENSPEEVLKNITKARTEPIIKEEEHFIEILLPKQSPGLHLITRIRDEAHRFAITYHRKLRSKQTLAALADIHT
jgi:excinuclease ABC subunit C